MRNNELGIFAELIGDAIIRQVMADLDSDTENEEPAPVLQTSSELTQALMTL